jgi:hypothetical protein
VAVKGDNDLRKTRTYRDRREYLVEAVRKRRKRVRQMAVDDKGGKCQECAYDRCIEALEFHHVSSAGKDFSISDKGYTRSWKRMPPPLCEPSPRSSLRIAASTRNCG